MKNADTIYEENRERVIRNPKVILEIKNAPERLIIEAIKCDPFLIRHYDNPSRALQMAAFHRNPESVMHINNPDPLIYTAIMHRQLMKPQYVNPPTQNRKPFAGSTRGMAPTDRTIIDN